MKKLIVLAILLTYGCTKEAPIVPCSKFKYQDTVSFVDEFYGKCYGTIQDNTFDSSRYEVLSVCDTFNGTNVKMKTFWVQCEDLSLINRN